jgi:hypothetical protein
MRSLGLWILCIGSVARGDASVTVAAPLEAAQLAGPYESLAAYCQKWVSDQKPDRASCNGKKLAGKVGPFREAGWVKVSQSGYGECRPALRTDAGWFVDERDELTNSGNRGRAECDVRGVEPLGGGVLLRGSQSNWVKPLTDAELDGAADDFRVFEKTFLCGIDGTPRCAVAPTAAAGRWHLEIRAAGPRTVELSLVEKRRGALDLGFPEGLVGAAHEGLADRVRGVLGRHKLPW